MKDLANRLRFTVAIPVGTSVADNTPTASAWIDRQGFESLAFVIQTGVLLDADATFAVTVQHADLPDFSDATATGDYDLVGAANFTFADDNVVKKVGYIGNRRYARITVTPANNSAAAPFSALAILGAAARKPSA